MIISFGFVMHARSGNELVPVDTTETSGSIRDVPTLFLLIDDVLMQEDFKVEQNFSTSEPFVGEAVVASYGRDTLIIDTAYTTSDDLQFTILDNDTVPLAFGIPVSVNYQPSRTGPVSDTLYIVNNDTASPFVIIFEGEAFEAYYEPQPELSLDGEVILPGNFANPVVVIDTTREMWEDYDEFIEFDLTNKGINSLNISNHYLKESNSRFSINGWESNNIPFQDTVTVTIYYGVWAHSRQIAAIAYDYYNNEGNLVRMDHWIAAENDYEGTRLEAEGPWVQEAPDSLVIDFGEVTIGNSAEINGMHLRNWGNVPLSIEFATTDNQFSYTGENPLFLYPGRMNDEGNEGIVFAPAEAGDIEGLLILNHNDTTAGAIDTVYLFGTGVEPPAPAEIALFIDNEQVDIGGSYELDLGACVIENDWNEIQLKMVNTGETDGHTNLNNIGNSFLWVDENGSISTSRNNVIIPANDTLELAIRFDPGSGNVYNYNTSIYIHELNMNTTLNLSGSGLARHMFSLRHSNSVDIWEYHSYSNYCYDGFEKFMNYTYTNLHTSQVTIDSITLVNAGETAGLTAEGLPVTLQPGERYSFETFFDPEIPDGLTKVSVKIYSDNYKEPVYVYYQNNVAYYSADARVEAISDNILQPAPSEIFFGDVSLIDGTREGSFRIWSSNGYNLVVDSLSFMTDTAGFSIDGLPAGTVIPEGDTVEFTVSFAPRNEAGPVFERVSLFYPKYDDHSGLSWQSRTCYLTGYAVEGFNHRAALSVNAGNTLIPHEGLVQLGDVPENGGSESLLLTLKNSGVQFVTVDSIIFSNPAFSYLWMSDDNNNNDDIEVPHDKAPEPEYYPEEEEGMTVWYNSDGIMSVYFDPATAGIINGTMTIYSDDPDHPEYVVKLAVNGTSGLEDAVLSTAAVYPNPAKSRTTVFTGTDEPATVEFFNANGSFMHRTTISHTGTVDITDFESGMYVVKITAKKESKVLRLIVR